MRKPFLIVIALMSLCFNSYADNMARDMMVPEGWLTSHARKAGLLTSFVAAQTLSGSCEAYRFGSNTYMINSGNYHAFETARDLALITTGWFVYAELRSNQKWYKKASHIIGSGLIARDAKEWSYKGCRYGNPFDYSEERNQHAICYFGIRNGKLTDLYIGTGKISGPIVDIVCMGLGVWLIDR